MNVLLTVEEVGERPFFKSFATVEEAQKWAEDGDSMEWVAINGGKQAERGSMVYTINTKEKD